MLTYLVFIMKQFLDLMALIFINIKTSLFQLRDYGRVIFNYYFNFAFFKIDTYLLLLYFFQNPFKISRKFLIKKGELEVYTYGETPLVVLQEIANRCQITSKDVVFELGCGRSRTCFWLHSFIKCKVVGIDFVPQFIEKANHVKEKFHLENIEFRLDDFLKADLREGTLFYLYAIFLSDQQILQLIRHFEKLNAGIKIVTMSFALNEYCENKHLFKVLDAFEATFPWGKGTVYIQKKMF